MSSDGELIAGSVADPERFAALVDTHADAIYRYLARRVGASAAEDLVSETFLRAFRSRAGYRDEQPTALPWLYGIATNLVRDHARSEQRRLETLARLANEAVTDAVHDHVDETVVATTVLAQAIDAVADLSGGSRDVVMLVAVEGLTYTETAAALGVPEGTVRSRLSRARDELRRSLDVTMGAARRPAAESARGACHG